MLGWLTSTLECWLRLALDTLKRCEMIDAFVGMIDDA